MIIPDEEFTAMFEAVKDGSKDVSAFNSVLCNGAQTKVRGKWGDLVHGRRVLREDPRQ
jgi:hypothetical protein